MQAKGNVQYVGDVKREVINGVCSHVVARSNPPPKSSSGVSGTDEPVKVPPRGVLALPVYGVIDVRKRTIKPGSGRV
ncbi:hypothetical protein ZHAS_00006892 [Anopheles sinensis]|uniref:Uncharacterized protein n=1 Tax=Anopheles sinensis TaxID=74873 RepID=A0A084VN80_ANOSI|nr:hypothetical protein ZHAS_00006892 [Anopheles sinensis]